MPTDTFGTLLSFLLVPLGLLVGISVFMKIIFIVNEMDTVDHKTDLSWMDRYNNATQEEMEEEDEPIVYYPKLETRSKNDHLCQYCGVVFTPNAKGQCSSCGAPRG